MLPKLKSPWRPLAIFAAPLVYLFIATVIGADEWISDISPDGRFAVHRTRDASGMNYDGELIA